jgi:TP901 family phage tail tape measure protein
MQNEQANSTVHLNGEQAKQELTVLAQRAEILRTKLKEANDAGDGKAFTKLAKELKDTTKQMNQMSKEAFDVKKILDDLSGSSMKDLAKAKKELDKQLKSDAVTRGSQEWDELNAQLKAVKTEISAISNESKVGAVGMEKFSGGFRQMVAGAAAGIAALSGVYMSLKKFMTLRMQLEDSQANLKSLTGLGDDDIQWLTDQAKKLSTSTTEAGVRITASSKEIIDGYTVIGSKRPDLLKNKEALEQVTEQALTLAAAGKMEAVPAFEAVTACMNQFNLGANQSNRIINVLGAGALEGSAEIGDLSDSMKNVGTVAANSNLTLEQTVAALEVLASKQLLGEEAGTKLRGALLKMKEAGVGYVSGAFNMRDAIVEIEAKLKSMGTTVEKDTYMQKVFGIENITAGMILLDNVDQYDKLTTAITGTTVAQKQAQINTDTTSAKLAQAKNNLNEAGMALVKNLEPALLAATNAGVDLLNIFVKYPALAISLIAAIGSITAAYLAYTVASMANVLWTKLVAEATEFANSKFVQFFKTLATNPYVVIGAAITAISVIIYKLATAQSVAEKAVKDYNTQVGVEITKSDQLFNAIKKTNQGSEDRRLLINKINEQYGSYLGYQLKETANNKDLYIAQNKVNQALREKYAIQIKDSAKSEIINEAVPKQAKIAQTMTNAIAATEGDAIAEVYVNRIQSILQNANYSDKGIAAAQNYMKKMLGSNFTAGMEFYPSMLATSIKNMNADLDAVDKKFDRIIKKTAAPAEDKQQADAPKQNSSYVHTTAADKKAALKSNLNNIDSDTLNKREQLLEDKENNANGIDTEKKYQAALLQIQIDALEKKKQLYTKGSKEWLALDKQILDLQHKEQTNAAKQQAEADKKSLESFKASHEAELNVVTSNDLLKRKQLENDLAQGKITQEKYDSETLKLDADTANERLQVANKYADEVKNYNFASEKEKQDTINAANTAAIEAGKAYNTAKAKLQKDGLDNIKEIESRYGVNSEKNNRDQYKKELADLKTALANKKISIERYNHDVSVLNKKHAEEKAQDVLDIANEASTFSSKIQEEESQAVDNKYAAELKAAEGNATETTAIEAKVEEEKKAIKKKYADVDLAISVAQTIANTAAAIMKAAPNIPLQILTAATGAAELALAIQQRQATANLWTGGFTEPGDKYQPAGIVHAGEFVANQDAVNNAPMRRIFNLIDYAQRTNTIARVTSADIASAVGIKNGFASGGYTSVIQMSGSGNSSGISKEDLEKAINKAMEPIATVNTMLFSEIQKGIKASVSVSGKDGIAENLDLYYKMVSNASRT